MTEVTKSIRWTCWMYAGMSPLNWLSHRELFSPSELTGLSTIRGSRPSWIARRCCLDWSAISLLWWFLSVPDILQIQLSYHPSTIVQWTFSKPLIFKAIEIMFSHAQLRIHTVVMTLNQSLNKAISSTAVSPHYAIHTKLQQWQAPTSSQCSNVDHHRQQEAWGMRFLKTAWRRHPVLYRSDDCDFYIPGLSANATKWLKPLGNSNIFLFIKYNHGPPNPCLMVSLKRDQIWHKVRGLTFTTDPIMLSD